MTRKDAADRRPAWSLAGPALLMLLLPAIPVFLAAEDGDAAGETQADAALAAYSDPSRIWGNGAERVIEQAYRLCFRTRIIGGRIMNLRMPFAQNNERDILLDEGWEFLRGGKGNPEFLWPVIEGIIDSEEFGAYTEALSDGREKVIIFDIPGQRWSSTRDLFELARMKAGSYRGLPHRPYVLVSGRGPEESDVYNYLYCVGLAGMDCSGFVWHVLSGVAREGGLDLGSVLRRALGVRRGGDPSWYAGTAFFDSGSSQILAVRDEIRGLRPADIILFRGYDGAVSHSAIIQSVDMKSGVIRYLQCTDEAPLAERGVHESFIYFDPGRPAQSLRDPELRWTQKRYAPFPGEKASPFSDDGERYRAFPELGGGRVVRLRALVPVIERLSRR
ncbi:MAG: peptidoglycan endopeptidase [Treponema sp.]|jgi:hypothetical protein|nr:peptidoglycan endopeptidase [Treponema sp.]